PLLRTGQLEQAPEQRSVPPPTLGNLLEVPPEIDVNRRIVSLPQAAILVAESLESQPRQRKMRTGRIVEIEELLPLPRRQRGGRTMPQRVESRKGILEQLIAEPTDASQAGHRDMAARPGAEVTQRANGATGEKTARLAAPHLD